MKRRSSQSLTKSNRIKKEVNDPKFPRLSNEVVRLKNTKGGKEMMSAIMEDYAKEYAKVKVTEAFVSLVQRGIMSVDMAAKECNMSEEEFSLLVKDPQKT